MISHLLLYYFTGTGNSYRAATWLADAAREQGTAANTVAIDAAQPRAEITGAGQMIGLLCPTHAFCAPWAMISFALRLPRGQATSAFVVLTRGGVKIGNVYVQGLEGSGAYLLALILARKGYRVVGATGLDMPVSWSTVIPGLSRQTAEAINARARPKIERFLQTLLSGGRCFRSIIELLFGILLLPVTVAYLLMGRFFFAKLFYASPRCDGCGVCARSCPVQAIRMQRLGVFHDTQPRPYWTFLCESCTRCMNFCPQNAIEASYPLGVLAFYLANIPLAAWLLDGLARWVTQAVGLKGWLVETIIQYPYKLLAIAAAYFLFTLALRIPFANRLLTLATPTHYYRRYHEPQTKLNEIAVKKPKP